MLRHKSKTTHDIVNRNLVVIIQKLIDVINVDNLQTYISFVFKIDQLQRFFVIGKR